MKTDSNVPGNAKTGNRSFALSCLATLAIIYTMYFAATLMIPVIAALLLYLLLSPLVKWAVCKGIPRTAAAIAIMTALIAGIGGTAYQLGEPGADWLREAPTSLAEFRAKLRNRPNPLTEVKNASEAVEDTVAEITGSGNQDQDAAPSVAIQQPTALQSVIRGLPAILASALVTVVLTLFFLIYGDVLLRRLVALGSTFSVRRRIVTAIRQIESDIARYLGTITLINFGLGCLVAGAMTLLGLPNPVLWGTVAAVLNFAPYLGPLITAATLLLVGFSTYDTYGEMFTPALVFLAINLLEGQIITPMLLGRRLELSPLVVFLSVVLMGWLWGLFGTLIAVPSVAAIRIILANSPGQYPLSRLLAR